MKRVFLCVCLFFCGPALAAESYSSAQSKATLIMEPGLEPNSVFVALKIELAKGWHTYWQNPGHAGLPPQFEIAPIPGTTISEIEYPIPERIETGQLVTFGYHNEVWLLRKISLSAESKQTHFTLTAKVRYLVCAEQCLQEKAELTTNFVLGSLIFDRPAGYWPWPQSNPGPFDPVLEKSKDGKTYQLHIYLHTNGESSWVNAWTADLQFIDFFPAKGQPIDLTKPQIAEPSIEHDVLTLKTTDLSLQPAKFQGLLVARERTTDRLYGFWISLDWPK